MKHLIIILSLLAATYVGWQGLDAKGRAKAADFAKRHGVRFLIATVALFMLFILAVQTKPFQLF